MKTILHLLLESPDSGWGGLATAVHLLARSTADAGIPTAVVTVAPVADRGTDASGYTILVAPLHEMPPSGFYTSENRAALGRAAGLAMLSAIREAYGSGLEADIVLHNEELTPLVDRLRAEPGVHTIAALSHGLMQQEHPGRADLHRMQKAQLHLADVVFAVSSSQAALLRKTYPDLDRVRYLPLPLSLLIPNGRPPALRAGELLSAGRSVKQKGFDILLRAFAGIRPQKGLRLRLVIGHGDTAYETECQGIARTAPNPVSFLPWAPPRVLLRRMMWCHGLIVPSRFEPLGLVAAEAMAVGCPVIASAVGGLRELIGSTAAGVLVAARENEGPSPEDLRGAIERFLALHPTRTTGPDLLRQQYGPCKTLAALAEGLER